MDGWTNTLEVNFPPSAFSLVLSDMILRVVHERDWIRSRGCEIGCLDNFVRIRILENRLSIQGVVFMTEARSYIFSDVTSRRRQCGTWNDRRRFGGPHSATAESHPPKAQEFKWEEPMDCIKDINQAIYMKGVNVDYVRMVECTYLTFPSDLLRAMVNFLNTIAIVVTNIRFTKVSPGGPYPKATSST